MKKSKSNSKNTEGIKMYDFNKKKQDAKALRDFKQSCAYWNARDIKFDW